MKANEQLAEALRLAVDPPGGVSVAALRRLVMEDLAQQWDIATAAQYVGVSPHTLRYYERVGLITVPRNAAGHRVYDASSVRRLVFLTRMRTSGMPISDLRHYVALVDRGDATIPDRLDMLLEHRDTLRAQLAQIQLALAATEYKIATYGGSAQP
ncbi:MerR family transcriptional regulator [Actinoplanes sp. KI2]|uniref:MerR family transcriptional regulator n=1 Tax=Actinoplanes sp. KI2 TaxID=2983315 RepID=UPI0021D59178|nr:MerR family transcriptional regulator [Actinoplanes sp. KI2]MCU7723406.1 MerR family transcriptional regulator [Actinoplanes sp. KI2]